MEVGIKEDTYIYLMNNNVKQGINILNINLVEWLEICLKLILTKQTPSAME